MGLNADDIDGDARVQATFDQVFILGGSIEIVENQNGIRVFTAGLFKHGFNGFDLAQLPADAGDGIVIAVKIRHDDHLVYDIPHINQAFVVGHLPGHSCLLTEENFIGGIFHQPGGRIGMPAQGMAF